MTLLSIILLCIPTAWKVRRDRNGVEHPDIDGVTILIILIFFMAFINAATKTIIDWHSISFQFTNDNYELFIKSIFLSSCIYASLFPYIINYVHLRRKVTNIKSNFGYGQTEVAYNYWKGMSSIIIWHHIVNHLSDSAIPDKWTWWRKLGWKGRGIVHLIVLTAGIIIYNL